MKLCLLYINNQYQPCSNQVISYRRYWVVDCKTVRVIGLSISVSFSNHHGQIARILFLGGNVIHVAFLSIVILHAEV